MLLLEGLYLLWRSHKGPEAKKLHSACRPFPPPRQAASQTQVLKQRMLGELPALERCAQPAAPAQRWIVLLQSGLNWTVSKLLLATAVLGGVGWSLSWRPYLRTRCF